MSTILDYYKYAALATAAYVRMGTADTQIGVGPLQRLEMQSLLCKLSTVLSLKSPFLMPKTAL
jgi:hypothetical protein